VYRIARYHWKTGFTNLFLPQSWFPIQSEGITKFASRQTCAQFRRLERLGVRAFSSFPEQRSFVFVK
jgi:hypothetical protein